MKRFISICLLSLLVLYSCSKRTFPTSSIDPVFYPSPPDTARIQFLTRYSDSFDLTGNPSKFKSFIAGQESPRPIIKPYGISLVNDRLFIADAGMGGLQVMDLKSGSFDYFTPGGRGTLKVPINCFVDLQENLFVTDVGRNQVVIFDKNLEYKGEIGGEDNFKPTDLVVTGDTIYITDPKNNRINAYDITSMQQLYSFPRGSEIGDDNWLYNPLNLCFNNGKIYVTDFGDSKIKVFNTDGDYIKAVGSYGDRLAQFARPKGIAVDREENLFVVDAAFENVQVFNKDMQLLMFFGGPYRGPGDLYLPANVIIDYDHLSYFEKYVDPAFKLEYLIFVTNQYGPDKVSVYGRIEPK